jgi:cytochrome c oxidase subunit 2
MLIPGFPLLLADKNASFWFPAQASTFAKEVDDFYMYIMYISIVFFVLIVAAMVWFTLQYRRRPGYQGDSRALHNNALEITWTVIPTLIVIWIFARGVYGYMDMMRPPADTIDVNVTAQKWAWSFQYPNGAISNELHIPVNRPSRMLMRSDDVLHSLFIPAFRCKTDVVPGRVIPMWFQPILTGTYDMFCTEYCGDEHSNMITKVIVHEQAEYEEWLAKAAQPPVNPVAHGQWLYERMGCKACHSIEGDKRIVGPSFSGTYGTEQRSAAGESFKVEPEYIRESILEPQKKIREGFQNASLMPSYQGKLKENEITALTLFIEALKDGKLTDEELGKNQDEPTEANATETK